MGWSGFRSIRGLSTSPGGKAFGSDHTDEFSFMTPETNLVVLYKFHFIYLSILVFHLSFDRCILPQLKQENLSTS